jgi:hypothetical protein
MERRGGGPFMIEQNAIGSEHAVGFPIVDNNPIGIQLGNGYNKNKTFSHKFFRQNQN